MGIRFQTGENSCEMNNRAADNRCVTVFVCVLSISRKFRKIINQVKLGLN